MNLFSINGMQCPVPVAHDESFERLMAHLHRSLTGESSLIASIRVNGIEIGPVEEADLATKPLSALESIEVTCRHPREIAEETLQALRALLPSLAELSRGAASQLQAGGKAQTEIRRLVDGLETLADAVTSSRTILRLGKLARLDALENDLLLILQDLLEAQRSGDFVQRAELLRDRLPANLEDWERTGIPEMIRSRDS